jgi:penicillin-binding protein 2
MTEASTRRRITVLGVVVALLFAGLLTRLWFLQVAGGEKLAVAAQENREKQVQVPALRGRILDAKGRVLAESEQVTTITVDRQQLSSSDRARLVPNLAALLGITEADVNARIDNPKYQPFEEVPVADQVMPEQAVKVTEHASDFPKTEIAPRPVRRYPLGALAANVLGYVGPVSADDLKLHQGDGYIADDTIGKTGVEQTFESMLRGVPQQETVEVDNLGRATSNRVTRKGEPGRDVQLTIDADTQTAAQNSLLQGMDGARGLRCKTKTGDEWCKATSGAVVVMDARTGAVQALVSAPTYDPNRFIDGTGDGYFADPAKPLLDRALSGYAPGSTWKLISSLAILESGTAPASETVDDTTGCFKFGNEADTRCNAGKAIHGYPNMPAALTVSSDVYFYSMGNRMWNVYNNVEGGDASKDHPVGYAIQNTARKYGFDAPTGIDLPNEYNGRMPELAFNLELNKNDPDPTSRTWRRGDSASLAVGQGDLLVTPLQLANAYATFANGGTLNRPRIASSVREYGAGLPAGELGEEVNPIAPQEVRSTELSPLVRQPILDGLNGVTNSSDGTAWFAFTGGGYQGTHVIGKTGTAQINGKGDTSWFVGITNPENDSTKPMYVVVAMVEEGGFGADVAAPIVRRIVDYLNDPTVAPAPVDVGSGDTGD